MLESFVEGTLLEKVFDYWYMLPHRKFLVINVWTDIHGFRLCTFLNDNSGVKIKGRSKISVMVVTEDTINMYTNIYNTKILTAEDVSHFISNVNICQF